VLHAIFSGIILVTTLHSALRLALSILNTGWAWAWTGWGGVNGGLLAVPCDFSGEVLPYTRFLLYWWLRLALAVCF